MHQALAAAVEKEGTAAQVAVRGYFRQNRTLREMIGKMEVPMAACNIWLPEFEDMAGGGRALGMWVPCDQVVWATSKPGEAAAAHLTGIKVTLV